MKIFKIDLDMIRQTKGYYIELVEDDYGSSTLNIDLKNNGVAVDLSEMTDIEVPFKKPDGTIYVHDLTNGVAVVDALGGKLSCVVSSVAMGVPGRVLFEVRLYKEILLATSTQMRLYVRRGIINDGSIRAMDEFPVLQQFIIQSQAITDEEAIRVQQEIAREQAEGVRENRYLQAEGLRNDAYDAAELVRDGWYNDAEGARDNIFGQAESARQVNELARVAAEDARKVFEPYDAGKQYETGNKVTYYGSSYVCVADNQGISPLDPDYWLLIARKGGISYPTFSVDEDMYLYMHDDFNYEGHVTFKLVDGNLIQEVS